METLLLLLAASAFFIGGAYLIITSLVNLSPPKKNWKSEYEAQQKISQEYKQELDLLKREISEMGGNE